MEYLSTNRLSGEYVIILGYYHASLANLLIRALIDHPEPALEDTFVRWTAEQDLVAEGI
jgi:hypothetical protein